MFSKTRPTRQDSAAPVAIPPLPDLKAPATAQAQSPVRSQLPGKAPSVLGSDITFEGNISGAGDLQIDGTVRGDVRVGRLTVGETGNVEGNVQADYVEVRGRVVGGVSGKQIKLISTAYVDGDISHEQLSIDVGAYFQGRCLQSRKAGEAGAQPAFSSVQPQPIYAQAQVHPTMHTEGAQLIELKPAG